MGAEQPNISTTLRLFATAAGGAPDSAAGGTKPWLWAQGIGHLWRATGGIHGVVMLRIAPRF